MAARTPESVYHGPPTVTPEREAAWEQYVNEYAAFCASDWISQGTPRQDAIEGAAMIICDFAQINDMPWMSLGESLAWRISSMLTQEELDGPSRIEFMRSLRTAETSTSEDRVLAAAYHLGVSVTQAESMTRKYGRVSDRPIGEKCALYRHFDEDGQLLYVGITKSPNDRAEQHSRSSKWRPFVADTTHEWHPDRVAAEEAERDAIQSERPIFNDVHNRSNREAAIDYLLSHIAKQVAS